MALRPDVSQSPDQHSLTGKEISSGCTKDELRAGLARVDDRCELHLSNEMVETLRAGGVQGLGGLHGLEAKHGKLHTVVMDCVEHGVFNEEESRELRGIIGDKSLSPDELAERLTKLLYAVLYRHLIEIEEEKQREAPRFAKSSPSPNTELETQEPNKKPFDPRDLDSGLAHGVWGWDSDFYDHQKDNNLEYLAKCLEQVIKKKEKEKEIENRKVDKIVLARFLGKASYPGPTIIPEETDV